MNWELFSLVFTAMFIAELGDKTQIAVFSLSNQYNSPFTVFAGASLALITVTLIGVAFGGIVNRIIPPAILKMLSGLIFLCIGVYSVIKAWPEFSEYFMK